MRYDSFPLDTQVPKERKSIEQQIKQLFPLQTCKFQVGSYSYDMTKMLFIQSNKVMRPQPNIPGGLLQRLHAYIH